MSEICPNCNGAGGDNNTWICGMCNGSGGFPRPQRSAEPVAYLYVWGNSATPIYSITQVVSRHRSLSRFKPEDGWTETSLYPASALEAARREALEWAAERVENKRHSRPTEAGMIQWNDALDSAAGAIRAFQEYSNG